MASFKTLLSQALDQFSGKTKSDQIMMDNSNDLTQQSELNAHSFNELWSSEDEIEENPLVFERANYQNRSEAHSQSINRTLEAFEQMENSVQDETSLSQLDKEAMSFAHLKPPTATKEENISFGDSEAWDQASFTPKKYSSQQEEDVDTDMEDLNNYNLSGLMESSVMSIHVTEEESAKANRRQESKLKPAPNQTLVAEFFPKAQVRKAEVDLTYANPDPQAKKEQQPSKSTTEHLSKIEELNKEIQHFKSLNETNRKLRIELEGELKRVQKEKILFEHSKREDLLKSQQAHQEEVRKFMKEKKTWERYQRANESLPNKREREEIEMLRRKVEELTESLRTKDLKFKLQQDRTKKRLDELSHRNHELQEQIRLLEQERVQAKKPPVTSKNKALADRLAEKLSKQTSVPIPEPNRVEAGSEKMHQNEPPAKLSSNLLRESKMSDGRTERLMSDGTRVTVFPSGSLRESRPDGRTTVRLANGDIKEIFADGSWEYFYAESKVKQRTLADGTVVFEFPDGQVEKRYHDGTTEILFTDKTVRYIFANGEEECVFPDGTISRTDAHGKKVVDYADGVREVYTKDKKQRFEVDGTVRTVYTDGRRETRYPDGRIRQAQVAIKVAT